MADPNAFQAPPKRLPQYDYIRQNAANQLRAQGNDQDTAMKRRFAAQGGLNSGAYIKQAQMQQQNQADQQVQAQQGIDTQEAGEVQRRQEIQDQYGEAQKSRDFASSEAGKQRDFQKYVYDSDQVFKEKVFSFEKDSKLAQLDFQYQDYKQSTISGAESAARAALESDDSQDYNALLDYYLNLYGAHTEAPVTETTKGPWDSTTTTTKYNPNSAQVKNPFDSLNKYRKG